MPSMIHANEAPLAVFHRGGYGQALSRLDEVYVRFGVERDHGREILFDDHFVFVAGEQRREGDDKG